MRSALAWPLPVHLIRFDEGRVMFIRPGKRKANRKGVSVMKLPTAATQSTAHAHPPGETDTRLRGRWLLLTRAVWISIALLALGLYVASVPPTLASLHALCTDVTKTCSSVGYITPD